MKSIDIAVLTMVHNKIPFPDLEEYAELDKTLGKLLISKDPLVKFSNGVYPYELTEKGERMIDMIVN